MPLVEFRGAKAPTVGQPAQTETSVTVRAPSWHDHLSPGTQLRDAFSASSAVFGGLPAEHRQGIAALAIAVAQTPVNDAARRQLLAFLSNDKSLVRGHQLEGMNTPHAALMMWRLLHAEAGNLTDDAEKAAMARVLAGYKNLFLSAVCNRYYRMNPGGREAHAGLQPALVAEGLSPTHAAVLNSGFTGHTTLTRVAMIPFNHADGIPAGCALHTYRESVKRALGFDAPRWLLGSYQQGMTEQGAQNPMVQSLITQTHALIHPGRSDGQVLVTRRQPNGKTKTKKLKLPEVREYLEKYHLTPVGNGIKATIHNGGAGARFDMDEGRTYDHRLLIPLAQASDALGIIQAAKLAPQEESRRMLGRVLQFDANIMHSVMVSPLMQMQQLGNCTVHSQRLCMLYELQHLGEFGDPDALSARAGAELFARMWGKAFDRVRRQCTDDSLRSQAKESGTALHRELAGMLEGRRREAEPQRVTQPILAGLGRARQTPRRSPAPVAMQRAALPRDAAVAQGRVDALMAGLMKMPPLPERPQTPEALGAWGANGGQTPPGADLVAWMQGIRGTAWFPVSIAEANAYDKLVTHILGAQPSRAQRDAASRWVVGQAYRLHSEEAASAFLADPRADHPALPTLRAMAFFQERDGAIAIQAGSFKNIRAFAKARAHDPLIAHLTENMRELLDQVRFR